MLDPRVLDILLLGPGDRRRQLQDLPVLGDVWTALARGPEPPPDLLITPTWEKSAAEVARIVLDAGERINRKAGENAHSVAYLNGLVVASLRLDDIVEMVFPATKWWDGIEDDWRAAGFDRPDPQTVSNWIQAELRQMVGGADRPPPPDDSGARQVARLGVLLGCFLAAHQDTKAETPAVTGNGVADPEEIFAATVETLGEARIVEQGADAITRILDAYRDPQTRFDDHGCNGLIYRVALNRPAEYALRESVPAIKGDAARSLFSISCRKIGWAVLDSGIDHTHPAFRDHAETQVCWKAAGWDGLADPPKLNWYPHRVKGSYNFQRIRAILGIKEKPAAAFDDVVAMIAGWCPKPEAEVRDLLTRIARDRDRDLPVDWRKVEPLIELQTGDPKRRKDGDMDRPPPKTQHPHGTHVAGIIGADWQERDKASGRLESRMTGVCPDIALYDCRVLGADLGDSEFAVSAALQFIRFYNEQGGHPRILGVNMSLSIRHNVRNFACGHTPVCVEAEALVSNGVVVVAAAGNRGYQSFRLADGTPFEGYASASITDPGNADGVITVGATHRAWPHTYGVSFFSSRGPTGDGRMKPDLLAPGEKIDSCIPGGRDEMDGTSMAAPHVSGAAALLMARHDELRGRPARVKEILCATATDLKRDRSYQGHGMIDVLRAIQSL